MSSKREIVLSHMGKYKVYPQIITEKIKNNYRSFVLYNCTECNSSIKTRLDYALKRKNGLCHSCNKKGKVYFFTHKKSHLRIYNTWLNIKSRCNNKNDINYPNYGGKGIKICEEWENSFILFNDWSIKNGYQDDLTIDRKEGHIGYTPNNCRWANYFIQSQNRRKMKNNTTGYSGICKKDGKYNTRIGFNGKRYFLGNFNNIEEAVNARNNFIKENKTFHVIQEVKTKQTTTLNRFAEKVSFATYKLEG